jgi:manganese efflux pump family protein
VGRFVCRLGLAWPGELDVEVHLSWFTILLVSIGLGMDALAVAIATSIILKDPSWRSSVRLSFHFGLFQAFMPVLGWLAGSTFEELIRDWDHWVAFGLLSVVGGRAIYSALRQDKEKAPADPTKGFSLVLLSVATSIDALAVGLSLAMLQVPIFSTVLVIGLVAAIMTLLGMRYGKRLGEVFGQRMEVVGGLVLLVIGFKILIEHTLL